MADDDLNASNNDNPSDDEIMNELASLLLAGLPAEPPADRIAMLRDAVNAEAAAAPGPATDLSADGASAGTGTGNFPPNDVLDRDDLATDGTVDLDRKRRESGLNVSWLAAAAAAVILLVGGTVLGLALARDYPSTGGEVEYAGPITSDSGAVAGELEVVKIGIGRVVSLDTFDLPILPTSEYYEIWFVAPDDEPGSPNRISAGTFHPDDEGRSEVTFAAAVDPAKYPVIEITAEPGDGNPAPTGPVVMRVQIIE